MKRGIWIIVGLAILGMSGLAVHEASGQKKEEKKVDAQPGERVFELRTYWPYPGKMKALEARFRDHTCKLFKKHDISVIGFWKPITGDKATEAKVKAAEAVYKAAVETTKVTKFAYELALKNETNQFELLTANLQWRKSLEQEENAKQALIWATLDPSEHKLIYLLAFPSREAAEKSWDAFRKDPDWIAAKNASEKDGKLVDKIESVFMKATDFSPMK